MRWSSATYSIRPSPTISPSLTMNEYTAVDVTSPVSSNSTSLVMPGNVVVLMYSRIASRSVLPAAMAARKKLAASKASAA